VPFRRVDSPESRGAEARLTRSWRVLLTLAIVAVSAAYVIAGARNAWDFETYYYAARTLGAGLNPYSLRAVSEIAGKPIELPFLYPPVALAVFLPLSSLSVATAAVAWMAFKVLLLGVLVWIWRRHFLPGVDPLTLVLTVLLGFNLAVLWDLRTGNVALLEATLLWLGICSYVRGQDRGAALWIVLGSVFKLLPIFLLGLVGLGRRPGRERIALIAAGLLLLAVMVLLPPGLSGEWRAAIDRAGGDRPIGDINPSALGISDWLVAALELPAAAAPTTALALYLIVCAIVIAVSIGPLFRVQATGSRVELVIGMILLWLLLSPRVMVYSYVMALVPVLYVIRNQLKSGFARGVAIALVVGQGSVRLLPGQPPAMLTPLSFVIVVAAWVLWIRSTGEHRAAGIVYDRNGSRERTV
jgi:hypothetical protein